MSKYNPQYPSKFDDSEPFLDAFEKQNTHYTDRELRRFYKDLRSELQSRIDDLDYEIDEE